MAITWVQTGTNPDGTPEFGVHWEPEPENGKGHLVYTGPHASGVVQLPDGTAYDVTAAYVEVKDEEHGKQVSHLIAVQHEKAGRFGFSETVVTHPETGEVISAPHDCGDHCGALKRES